jgi:DNA (cytosine-5)-methyltransferase 1
MNIKLDAINENTDFCWDVVRKVVNGEGTRNIYSAIELSQLWNTSLESVPLHANQLKSIGFEVRNSNTNPQIPKACFLIPYSFPTLTPKSVQLHKKL